MSLWGLIRVRPQGINLGRTLIGQRQRAILSYVKMKKEQKIFSQIYDQYIDKIYRFIFLKVNSQEKAEDLCSETFLRGWQKFRENSQEIENPQAFLYQIARNLVIDHYREKGKVQFVSADCVQLNDPEIGLEDKAIKASDLKTVRTALKELKAEYQDVVIWHYIDDLSIREIAEMTKNTEGAIRVTLCRALKDLRSKIEEI